MSDEDLGKVSDWRVGLSEAGKWARLSVDLGIMETEITLTSRQARDFAIEVLTYQAPHLGYQPPNHSMRESSSSAVFDHGRKIPRRDRGVVRNIAAELRETRERVGDLVFSAALNESYVDE